MSPAPACAMVTSGGIGQCWPADFCAIPRLAQRGGPSTLGVAMAWLHQGIKGAVFAEVGLRPDRLTDAEDRTLARLRFRANALVHLTRRDEVAQAVSYVKAQQTGLWHAAPDGAELERLSPPQEPAYDASEIRTRLEEVTSHDHGWEYWFAASEIAPLRITYEELSDGPVETLRVIMDHLGLEREAADGVELGLTKLADNINQDWVTHFRSEQKPTP